MPCAGISLMSCNMRLYNRYSMCPVASRASGRGVATSVIATSAAGFSSRWYKTWTDPKKAFPTARPVHTVPCTCVPPWPVPWATWHSAELTHATRVANHRARAQSTQSSPPAADGDWSTTCFGFFAASQSSMALPTALQHAGCTLLHVERAPSMSASSGQARGVLGPCKTIVGRCLGESTRPDP